MNSESRGLTAGIDIEEMRLPRLVRSQLQRHQRARTHRPQGQPDIEERVREALYGKAYYGSRRHIFTDSEGDHGS